MNPTPGWLVVHHHSQQPVTFVVEEDGSGLETQCLGAVREFSKPGMRAQRIQPGMARESIVAAVSLVDCEGQQLQRAFGLVQSRQQERCTKKTLWIRGMKPQRLIECFQALSAIALQISHMADQGNNSFGQVFSSSRDCSIASCSRPRAANDGILSSPSMGPQCSITL